MLTDGQPPPCEASHSKLAILISLKRRPVAEFPRSKGELASTRKAGWAFTIDRSSWAGPSPVVGSRCVQPT